MAEALEQLREQINLIDREILSLLNKRADLAIKIGEVKGIEKKSEAKNGHHQTGHSVMRHEREAQILREMCKENQGLITEDSIRIIYKEIISACRSLESPISVSYLGPKGTYSELAVKRYFGDAITFTPKEDIPSVFKAIENKQSSFGMVPIENSYEGLVTQSIDALMNMENSFICAEQKLIINHHLISHEDTLENIDILYTHEQTLSQCRDWIDHHKNNWKIIMVASNGEAARLTDKNKRSAAIASTQAAEIFSLNILHKNIQTQNKNITRFLVIGDVQSEPSGDDITTIVFALVHKTGALHQVLKTFAQHKINMLQIISRPCRRAHWEYLFFVDLVGHAKEEPLQSTLAKLKNKIPMIRSLGSYPKSDKASE